MNSKQKITLLPLISDLLIILYTWCFFYPTIPTIVEKFISEHNEELATLEESALQALKADLLSKSQLTYIIMIVLLGSFHLFTYYSYYSESSQWSKRYIFLLSVSGVVLSCIFFPIALYHQEFTILWLLPIPLLYFLTTKEMLALKKSEQ
ncbi:MAG: hypothetical protein HQK50_11810 [Oligoflexia bacterium]|nr:hypothetical protein [Oligoflexia bacterium]MBF0366249.1 hypothetical protein [Oligoflexia bacterium]